MLRGKAREVARRYVPAPLKRLAGRAFAPREGRRPALAGRGVIEDLCYWTVDARLDTVLPLQNYFSVLYPDVATATRALCSWRPPGASIEEATTSRWQSGSIASPNDAAPASRSSP